MRRNNGLPCIVSSVNSGSAPSGSRQDLSYNQEKHYHMSKQLINNIITVFSKPVFLKIIKQADNQTILLVCRVGKNTFNNSRGVPHIKMNKTLHTKIYQKTRYLPSSHHFLYFKFENSLLF